MSPQKKRVDFIGKVASGATVYSDAAVRVLARIGQMKEAAKA